MSSPRHPVANRSKAKRKKKHEHKRREVFVPLQRHLYGEKRVFMPCPGNP
jgi:hypothetical protein